MEHVNPFALVNLSSQLKRKLHNRITTQQAIDMSRQHLMTVRSMSETVSQDKVFSDDDYQS